MDTSDLSKACARQMEYPETVRDGSRKTIRPGCWLVGTFLRRERGRIVPMVMRCFSTLQATTDDLLQPTLDVRRAKGR